MEIDQIMHDAYSFTRTALAEHPARWIALTIIALVPVLNLAVVGYLARVFGNEAEPPALDDFPRLFIDGLRLVAVSIGYLIVNGCVFLLLAGGAILVAGGMYLIENHPFDDISVISLMLGAMSIGAFYLLVAIASVIVVAVTLLYFMAMVRAARTRSIGQAFAIGGILDQIREIGWLNYLSALLILNFGVSLLAYVVIGLGLLTLGIGLILVFPLIPALGVFTARYLSNVYDCDRAVPTSPEYFTEDGGSE